MTFSSRKTSGYPKKHLLAASGAAAMLSLSLLIFPSSEVEAKKTLLSEDYESSLEAALQRIDGKERSRVTSSLDLSQYRDDEVEPTHQHLVTVQSGDNLAAIFARTGLSATTLHKVLDSSEDAGVLASIRPGQVFNIQLDTNGELQSLSSQMNALESVQVSRSAEGFAFQHEVITPEVVETHTHGEISSSLIADGLEAGLSYATTLDLANIFGYDIDFALDLREGDSFEVLYEDKLVDGERVGSGDILAARFINRGQVYTAVRFTDSDGRTSYYSADGNSLRKAFIRTPVDIARISSRFNLGRRHPILNKIRAHKGVDYAAPSGTPIKATGDGVVKVAGRQGGYGNTIIIQHGRRYQTLYAHMKGFAKGVKSGSKVTQGQIIGYIGTTGLSTGPHLHYEFRANGVHVDPLSEKLPVADPVAKADMPKFRALSQQMMARLDEQLPTAVARNESEQAAGTSTN